jgi:para-nitrobenzyl esterase
VTDATVARTALGDLQGVAEQGVVAFRDVAYALPPVGDLRFAPPVAQAAWSGLRDAVHVGPVAPQAPSRLRAAMGDFTAAQDEDCLTLTIWTPGADARRRPVMVWLHGGAWSSGAGSLAWYDGGALARAHDIVVVGVNYRLGALGYLVCPGISPGNLGTQDQVAALQWVRDHIGAFGGDRDCVTVAGQSAGAATIGRMIVDPASRALFRRAIVQSGGFGRPPLDREQAGEIGAQFVRLLDIDPEATDAAARMRAVPVARLIAAQGQLAAARAKFADTTPPFMPVVEAAMREAGLIAAIAAGAGDLDLLIGSTREECHAFFAANPAMADPPADAVARQFAALAGDEAAIAGYRARRPGGSTMDVLSDLATDHVFRWPTLRLAAAAAAQGARVFAYQFDWGPPTSRFKACHCIELPFMFGTLDSWPDAPMLAGGDAGEMAALSAAMQRCWAGFVRDGNPASDGLTWAPYDAAQRATMVFGPVCGMAGNPAGLGET